MNFANIYNVKESALPCFNITDTPGMLMLSY